MMEIIKEIAGSEAYISLLNKNISTISDILISDTKIIQDITGVSSEIVDKIKLSASEHLLKNNILTADQIEPWERISTGCKGIDAILLGGIPINGISEIYGFSGVGKTQFCLQLALNIQLPNQLGGKSKEAIYLCTEDLFPSKRFNQLAEAYRNKYNIKIKFEDHVFVKHIADTIQLQKCLSTELPHLLSTKNVGLVVIDSITGIFRSENENSNYISRSHAFKEISKALNNLQEHYNCGLLTVNQVTDNISTGISEPCLGLAWANIVVCRFCLSRNSDNPIRTFEVTFAPDLPVSSSNIIICSEGLLDV